MALEKARKDTIYCGHPALPGVRRGMADDEWMPQVATAGLIAIGGDRRLRTRPGERELVAHHKARVIRLYSAADLPTWGFLAILMRHWDSIDEFIDQRPGPWWLRVSTGGLREQRIFQGD